MPRGACRDRSPRSHRPQPRRGRRDRRLPDLGRAVAEARVRRDRAREPHAVPPRRGPREPAARTRAGLGAAVRRGRRGRAAALLAARAAPPEGVGQLLRRERGRARRGPVLEPDDARRTNPRSRCSARTATAPTASGGQVTRSGQRQAGHLAGAAAQHRAPALHRRPEAASTPTARPTLTCARHRHHHVRPAGTPMQAWGVAGGGPKNDQSIQDLVAFLRTIQLTPDGKAQKQAQEPRRREVDRPDDVCPQYMTCPVVQETRRAQTLKTDTATLATSRAGRAEGARRSPTPPTPSSPRRATRHQPQVDDRPGEGRTGRRRRRAATYTDRAGDGRRPTRPRSPGPRTGRSGART